MTAATGGLASPYAPPTRANDPTPLFFQKLASGLALRKLNGAFQMLAATAIIWAVGLIIATYAGTPPSFIVILIVLLFLWGGWQIRQHNPESRWWD